MSSNIIDTSLLAFNIEKIRRSVFPEPVPIDLTLKDDDILLTMQNAQDEVHNQSTNVSPHVADERYLFRLEVESLI